MKNIFLLILSVLIFSCRQGPKSYEYYAAKEKLSKADIGYIIEEEFKLANKGVKMLGRKIDSTTIEEIFLLNDDIEKWGELRKRIPGEELTRQQLEKFSKVAEFSEKWTEFLSNELLDN